MGMPRAHLPHWAAVADHLSQQLQLLADGASVTVRAPEQLARPAKKSGLKRRLLGTTYQDTPPWIRLERIEDHLVGRCVNDHKDLGFPLSPDEKAALLALGWHEPTLGDGPELHRWFPDDVPSAAYLPLTDATAAAALTLRSLREVFAVPDPSGIVISS